MSQERFSSYDTLVNYIARGNTIEGHNPYIQEDLSVQEISDDILDELQEFQNGTTEMIDEQGDPLSSQPENAEYGISFEASDGGWWYFACYQGGLVQAFWGDEDGPTGGHHELKPSAFAPHEDDN